MSFVVLEMHRRVFSTGAKAVRHSKRKASHAKKKKAKNQQVKPATEAEAVTATARLVDGELVVTTADDDNTKAASAVQVESSLNSITTQLKEISMLQQNLPTSTEVLKMAEKYFDEAKSAKVSEKQRLSSEIAATLDLYRTCAGTAAASTVNANFYENTIEACVVASDPEKAASVLREMLQSSSSSHNKFSNIEPIISKVLKCCEDTGHTRTYYDVLKMCRHRVYEPESFLKVLQLCLFKSKHDLQTAVLAIREIRASSTSDTETNTALAAAAAVPVKYYYHALELATRDWDSDSFLNLLIEMRIDGYEPMIPSLTSLEPNRVDAALTVMEGIRAVGLNPNFALNTVLHEMKLSTGRQALLDDKSQRNAGRDCILKDVLDKKTSAVVSIDWNVTPMPQLMETQAAGLLLNKTGFRRLKYKEVNRIDDYLKLLPIDVNLSINLKRQLQRKAVAINTKHIRRDAALISSAYDAGTSLADLAAKYDYPPVSLLRIILKQRGVAVADIKDSIANTGTSSHLSPRDVSELKKAKMRDSVHASDPLSASTSYVSPGQMEELITTFIRSRGIRIATEKELKTAQRESFGRCILTPDILFLDPVTINGTPVRWIDVKNIYGSYLVNSHFSKTQMENYVREFGTGAVVYGMGFSDMLRIPGVMCLDASIIPKTGWELRKMKWKAAWLDVVSKIVKFNVPTLRTELSEATVAANEAAYAERQGTAVVSENSSSDGSTTTNTTTDASVTSSEK